MSQCALIRLYVSTYLDEIRNSRKNRDPLKKHSSHNVNHLGALTIYLHKRFHNSSTVK